VTVFLTNGTRLEGKIVGFDPQTILVDSGEHNLVYKTMILTISPPRKGMRPRRPMGGGRDRPDGPRREGGRPPFRDRDDMGVGRSPYRTGGPDRGAAGGGAGGYGDRPPYDRTATGGGERVDGAPPPPREPGREPRVPVVRYKRRLSDR